MKNLDLKLCLFIKKDTDSFEEAVDSAFDTVLEEGITPQHIYFSDNFDVKRMISHTVKGAPDRVKEEKLKNAFLIVGIVYPKGAYKC